MARTSFDPHQIITDQIIAALEAGTPPWRKPWSGSGDGAPLPLRATGDAYRGINVLVLWCTAIERGHAAPHWMTFRQAKELGGHVRKGEKSTMVVHFGTIERDRDGAQDEGAEDEGRSAIPYTKAYRVFNVEQIDGLPDAFVREPAEQIDTGEKPIPELEAIFARIGVPIEIGGTRACYRPDTDTIAMPPVSAFHEARDFYSVLAHESVHATGHKTRLDRFSGDFDTRARAFEEIIAEIGACFFGAQIGTEPPVDQSAAYIATWLDALHGDKRFIFKAASAAQKASDLLMSSVAEHNTDPMAVPRNSAAA